MSGVTDRDFTNAKYASCALADWPASWRTRLHASSQLISHIVGARPPESHTEVPVYLYWFLSRWLLRPFFQTGPLPFFHLTR